MGMKEITITLPDEMMEELDRISAHTGIPLDELIKRSIAEYIRRRGFEVEFDEVGFGMWADRAEMEDSTKWVRETREREWRRS